MLRRILALAALFVFAARAQAAIVWTGFPSGPVLVGQTYGVAFYDSPTSQPPPDMTVRLYKNGVLVSQAPVSTSYTTEESTAGTITYLAVSYTGQQASRTVTVVAANQPPIGWLDGVSDQAFHGQPVYASGWAADNEMGAPVTRVDIYIDGVDCGDATLGGDRPDVAAAYARSDYRSSGWSWNMNTASLSLGDAYDHRGRCGFPRCRLHFAGIEELSRGDRP
ncbi:MAG: hypothetical protein HC834_00945 [Rhodospirillales bacterium]|nr:hypothetical protein [Rhodospirillales bacterium]